MDNIEVLLGVDVGGSHISAALMNAATGKLLTDTYLKETIDARGEAGHIIGCWAELLNKCLSQVPALVIGTGVAMPGPFDYEKGISLIAGLNKYESLYGLNIKELLQAKLDPPGTPLFFENDATCFGIGECLYGEGAGYGKVIAITLGTGIGSAFLERNECVRTGAGIPPDGYLYNRPFKGGRAEDYLSAPWLLEQYGAATGRMIRSVKEMADLAMDRDDEKALAIFRAFGNNLGVFLSAWIGEYKADCLVIGGGIARSAALFLPEMEEVFAECQINISNKISLASELSAIGGAAALALKKYKV